MIQDISGIYEVSFRAKGAHVDEHKADELWHPKKNFVKTTRVSLEKVNLLITTAATARS